MAQTKKRITKTARDNNTNYAIGRRKKSIAHVWFAEGKGKVTINGKTPREYFPNEIVINDMMQPLVLLLADKKFDINVKVNGGGFSGQAGAIRLAIANVLVKVNGDDKKILKLKKLTTRDKRVKERKKYGKYGARRSPQFTKR